MVMGIFLMGLTGFVLAASGDTTPQAVAAGTPNLDGQTGEQGNISEEAFIEEENNKMAKAQGESASGDQLQKIAQEMTQVRDGNYETSEGKQVQVQTREDNKMELQSGGMRAQTSMQIMSDTSEGSTMMKTTLSSGRDAEIKVMPDTASETALGKLKLKNCVEEEGCTIELKEVGKGDKTKAAYEVKTQRQSKVLGLFKAQMQVEAQVNAENGELIRTKKPWWAFLASEPQEE